MRTDCVTSVFSERTVTKMCSIWYHQCRNVEIITHYLFIITHDKSSKDGIWPPVQRSHNKRAATHADLFPCGMHLLMRVLYNHNSSYLSFFLRVVGRRLELCSPVDEGGSSSHMCIYDRLIFFMHMLFKCMFIVSMYLVIFLPWLQKYTGHLSSFVEV